MQFAVYLEKIKMGRNENKARVTPCEEEEKCLGCARHLFSFRLYVSMRASVMLHGSQLRPVHASTISHHLVPRL